MYRVEFIVKEEKSNNENKYEIILSHNHKNIILYALDLCNFNKWRLELKKTCILTNYHKYYENLRMIKYTITSKIILTLNKEEKKEYAVKIYEKKSFDEDLKVILIKLSLNY